MMYRKTESIVSSRLIVVAMLASQALVGCGEMDTGYEQLDTHEEDMFAASSESSTRTELRGELELETCEDQGFDSYELSEEVSVLWNEYVEDMQDRRLASNLVRLVSGFEQLYCADEVAAKVWANGRPTCNMASVPVSNGRNFSLRADSQDNPAVIQIKGCVLSRAMPEAFRR